jgi:hypothetical protein
MKRMNAHKVGLLASLTLAIIFTALEIVVTHLGGQVMEWYFHVLFFLISFLIIGLAFRLLYGQYIYHNLHHL